MDSLRRGALALVAASVALGLTGCGMADRFRYPYAEESAETIFLDSVTATTEAESLRISGSFDPKGMSAFSFSFMSDGEQRCSGQLTISTAEFDVVLTPDGDYLRGSSASWENLPGGGSVAAGRRLEDRWVRWPRADRLGLTPLCSLASKLLTKKEKESVEAGRVPDGIQLTHGGLSEAAGEKAVKLHTSYDKGATDVWVSLEEPHYIVKLTEKSRKGTAKVVFSDFGFPAQVSVPKGKDVVDVKDLSARSG